MDKPIIVYYSLEGNTELIAKAIAADRGWDLLRIEPKKSIPGTGLKKYFWGGRQVVLGQRPELQAIEFSAAERPFVLIGSPIWAGSCAPPIATFLDIYGGQISRVAAFFCHAGGRTSRAEDLVARSTVAGSLMTTLALLDPEKKDSDAKVARALEWARSIQT